MFYNIAKEKKAKYNKEYYKTKANCRFVELMQNLKQQKTKGECYVVQ